MRLKTTSLIFFIFLSLTIVNSFVDAHSNYLYDVSLDFDPEFKDNIVDSGKSFFNTSQEPVKFDYYRELVVAVFNTTLERSVAINPLNYKVFGYRDDSLVTRAEATLSTEEIKEVAKNIFENSVSDRHKGELIFDGQSQTYTGTYELVWNRYVNNILVLNEGLTVEVDPATGNVVSWMLSIFLNLADSIDTTPAISHELAEQIAIQRFDAEPADFKPVLVIDKDQLVWITKVKVLYDIYVVVDANTGRVVSSGNLDGNLPESYDYGRDIKVQRNELINHILEGE